MGAVFSHFFQGWKRVSILFLYGVFPEMVYSQDLNKARAYLACTP